MTYNLKNGFNVGDYIQSMAARQFLPKVDRYIGREELHEYRGPITKVIMNGHFMRYPYNWPPSPDIVPLFVSFHMNPRRAEKMLSDRAIAYFKSHEPIGCRDLNTVRLLREKGIEASYSSCLTLTLGGTYRHRADEDIFLVDVLYAYPTWKTVFKSFNSLWKTVRNRDIRLLGKRKALIEKICGEKIVRSASQMTQVCQTEGFGTEDSRFELADRILKRYERAKLVITSRIHCALPCLAMGTPVVFVNGGFDKTFAGRFGGICDLFNTVEVDHDGNISSDFDLHAFRENLSLPTRSKHLEYIEPLRERCKAFADEG
jgi:hypothetical protein